jgi:hypothetical protein
VRRAGRGSADTARVDERHPATVAARGLSRDLSERAGLARTGGLIESKRTRQTSAG